MLLMIDNYDSFTYNLVQYFGELGQDLKVYRNNRITISEIEKMGPDRIVVSPGPCTPREAGVSIEVIRHFAGKVPILGVCLGHQSIGDAFGGDVIRAPYLMHGKTSMIHHDGRTLFSGLPNPFEATRYHSLIIKRETLPPVPGGICLDRGRHHHGRPAQTVPGRGSSVPPRIDPDRRGQGPAEKFFKALKKRVFATNLHEFSRRFC